MGVCLPLPTLLSHALVAFTIEFDNQSERQIRHRTTRHGASANSRYAPWLVSLVMWSNCMRFVAEQGVPVRELERMARTKANLSGMQRWGHVVVEPDPADRRPKPPRSAWQVRATPAGREADKVLQALFDVIEKRWGERFGQGAVEHLRESLRGLADRFEIGLPDGLPILGYGLFSRGPNEPRGAKQHKREDGASLLLPVLLSQVLLAFAIDFENESDLSLAISANVWRVLDEEGARVKDLPMLSGFSKEAISGAMGILLKRHMVALDRDRSGGRWKIARLTRRTAAWLRTHIVDGWPASKIAGRSALGRPQSGAFASPWSNWSANPQRRLRRCSGDWNRLPTGGGHRCAGPQLCRTILWCCTAADSQMAAKEAAFDRCYLCGSRS